MSIDIFIQAAKELLSLVYYSCPLNLLKMMTQSIFDIKTQLAIKFDMSGNSRTQKNKKLLR